MPLGYARPGRFVLVAALCLAFGASSAKANILFTSNFNANNGGLTVATLSGSISNPWTYSATAGVGGNGAWFTNGTTTVSSKALTSPSLTVTSSGPISISFDHRFSFEFASSTVGFDGGQLYVSVNAGAFTLVPQASFTANGYTHTISTGFSNPVGGQKAWSGNSAGYSTPAYITSTATLGSLNAGDTVAFRFRGSWDNSFRGTTPNWVIDNVTVTDSGVSGTAVPAPSSLALLGAGAVSLAGAAWRRWRRQPA